jgi:HAE1 family hydrophobic/amphiphilic exporter-1
MSLSNFAVNAPVKVTMIFLGVLLLGWISLTRLPTSLFPDIRTPRVTTTIKTRGLSTLEVERRICQPMERALYTIRGVSDVQSISRADTAVIITEFTWDTLLDYAFIDVKKAVSDVQRDRGEEIESATVLRYDPNAVPVVTIALKGNDRTSAEDLYKLAKNTLRSRFERLEGIANVVIAGGIEREMAIKVDETLLLAYGLDVAQVVQALQSDNVNAAGGFVEEGARRYLLKAVGEYRDMDEVASTVVGRAGESSILLKDVATLSMDPREENRRCSWMASLRSAWHSIRKRAATPSRSPRRFARKRTS